MSSSTQPTSAPTGDAASSTPETAPESLTPSASSTAAQAPADAAAAAPADAAAAASADAAAAASADASAAASADASAAASADASAAASADASAAASADAAVPAADGSDPAASAGKPGAKTAGKAAQDGGRVDVPAVAAALKDLFPALFSGPAKPVKLRIQADIQERAPGQFSKQQLSAFLRRYTGGTGYLIGLTKAKHRFDLDGQPAGDISDEHRQAAQEELTRRRGITETRRADEERGRQERAQLLRDFSRTTLTPANFCALKGLTQEQLDAQLALAREEEAQQPPRPPRDDRGPRGDRRPHGPGRPDGGRGGERRGDRPAAGGERRAEGGQRPARGEGRPRGDGPNRPDGGKRPPRRSNG